MAWFARAIPLLLRVIGRGGRISAKHGMEGASDKLPQVTEKARRADGWNRTVLSVFAEVVGAISATMTIFKEFSWGGLTGDAADAAKRRCDDVSASCKAQDDSAAEGASSVDACGRTVDEVLEDCECKVEDMAQQADDILSQCEPLVGDPEIGSQAAKVAQDVCNALADCASQLYEARNMCVEQCLDQAAADTECAVVEKPATAPTVAGNAGGTSAAGASGLSAAAAPSVCDTASTTPQSAPASSAPVAPVPLSVPEQCQTDISTDTEENCGAASGGGAGMTGIASGGLTADLTASINAGVSAGVSAGLAVGAAGAAGIVGAVEGVASGLLNLGASVDIDITCSTDAAVPACELEQTPISASQVAPCEPQPCEPQPSEPQPSETEPSETEPEPCEPEPEPEPEPVQEPVPEPAPPAEKLRHMGIEVPDSAAGSPAESAEPAGVESGLTSAPLGAPSASEPVPESEDNEPAPSVQQSAPSRSEPLAGVGAAGGASVNSPTAGEW